MDDPGPSSFLLNAVSSPLVSDNPAIGQIDTMDLMIQIPLLLLLILVNAFFAMSEIAIISLNDTKIERMAEDGHKKAKLLMKLTENSSSFLSTIQIGVTLAGFLTSASAATSFADALATAIHTKAPDIPLGILNGVCVVLITIVISYFSLVLGELVPKRIAMQAPEKVSFAVAGPLCVVAKITKPFVKVLSLSTNAVVRLFGFDPNADTENVTEEEILMMVDVGEEKGVIENVQKEMINNVFDFNNLDAGDIMTHRTDMTCVEADDTSFEAIVRLAIETGFSRIPLYDDDPDNIIGVIYVKDLLKYVGKQLPGKNTLRSIMREAYFVPETKPCDEIFKEMSAQRIQLAIVIDEFGGTAGLLTLEDLIEAVMGNIQDEYDHEDEEISRIDDNTFTIDGVTDIEEVEERIGVTFPDGEYDTLGGFIISKLRRLPKEGELDVIMYENITFTVLNVEDKRIGKVKVEIAPHNEQDANDKSQKDKED